MVRGNDTTSTHMYGRDFDCGLRLLDPPCEHSTYYHPSACRIPDVGVVLWFIYDGF